MQCRTTGELHFLNSNPTEPSAVERLTTKSWQKFGSTWIQTMTKTVRRFKFSCLILVTVKKTSDVFILFSWSADTTTYSNSKTTPNKSAVLYMYSMICSSWVDAHSLWNIPAGSLMTGDVAFTVRRAVSLWGISATSVTTPVRSAPMKALTTAPAATQVDVPRLILKPLYKMFLQTFLHDYSYPNDPASLGRKGHCFQFGLLFSLFVC